MPAKAEEGVRMACPKEHHDDQQEIGRAHRQSGRIRCRPGCSELGEANSKRFAPRPGILQNRLDPGTPDHKEDLIPLGSH